MMRFASSAHPMIGASYRITNAPYRFLFKRLRRFVPRYQPKPLALHISILIQGESLKLEFWNEYLLHI